ncbi:MAG: RluA family pseudouridine synthase [Epulopiscium sp.]|nr:RluA family pseudouridine synthase [Candidatus Epulonipiscium sp.]
MKEIKITQNEANQRLDKFLLKYMNKASKGFVYKMLRKKRIKLNQARAEGSEMLKNGDSIQLYLAEETMTSFMEEKAVLPAKRHFGIVYEDDAVLFVSKPAGLLTHPENAEEKNTLIDQILFYLYEKGQYLPSKESSFTPAVCNRLDRNTSGLIAAGKTLEAVQCINQALAERKLKKYYLTIISGKITEAGKIHNYLLKDNFENKIQVFSAKEEESKEAVTIYRPLISTDAFTLLEIELITGKTHQIRAHMQSIGHPIIGDRKYGDKAINEFFRKQYGLSHQFLHSARMLWQKDGCALSYLSQEMLYAPLPKLLQTICEGLFGHNAVDRCGISQKEEEKK